MKQTNRLIFVLSLLGIATAIYVLQSFLRHSSIICFTGGCEAVRKSPSSYLFGIFPVPAVGLIGYICLTLISFLKTIRDKPLYDKLLFGIALFGVCFVTWFTYTEIFIIHAICTWYLLSTLNMIAIFLILTFSHISKLVNK